MGWFRMRRANGGGGGVRWKKCVGVQVVVAVGFVSVVIFLLFLVYRERRRVGCMAGMLMGGGRWRLSIQVI